MPKKKSSAEQFNFSAALKELDTINAWFEQENTDLNEGLVKFKRALELIQSCKKTLTEAKNEIHDIKKEFNALHNENED
ncbi:exodeoxyribonuclease VII small subunit [Patescibacteria group bacterium]|jgi:exodeoxyribonuclease VII small subunit|nr:exodeoxyribonuclease VII small subunit [Patescibacteria group bacterium]